MALELRVICCYIEAYIIENYELALYNWFLSKVDRP